MATDTPMDAAIATAPRVQSLGDGIREQWDRIRGGEVGALPVLIGIALIVAFFQFKNTKFLSPGNFVDLITQLAGPTIIAMGVVFVLLLGEIDLSAGLISGVGGVAMAEMLLASHGDWTGTWWAGLLGIGLAIIVGLAVGLFQGSFVAYVGVPSFVVTLAGFLTLQGVLLRIIGEGGTVGIQNETIFKAANAYVNHRIAWIVAIAGTVLLVGAMAWRYVGRIRNGLPVGAPVLYFGKAAAIGLAVLGVTWYCNSSDQGLPVSGLIVAGLLISLTFLVERTRFGRHIVAVGGNEEAARRSGIPTKRIKVYCFMIASALAGLGGVILASRLNSVSPDSGGGTLLLEVIAAAVIGGTSLFGGRGRVISALLGSIVIYGVENGIDLLAYDAAYKYIVTGLILLAAVTVDTLSRKRLAKTGR